MKKLSTYLFLLLFSFQTSSWADDIRDFQIEEISIGDSLLNYFTEEKINNGKSYYYSTKKFYLFGSSSPSYQIYDMLQFTLKNGDKKYIIYGISGKLFYENNFKDCLKKKDEIVKEVTDLLGNNTKIQDRGTVNHTYDKSGKSKATTVDFFLNTGGGISVYCTDWSEEMGFMDNLKVFAVSKELDDYFETVK